MIERTRFHLALGARHLARALECVVLAGLMVFGSLANEVRRIFGLLYAALVAVAVSRRVRALIVFTILLALPFLFLETSHTWAVPGPSIPLRIPAAPAVAAQVEKQEVAFLPEVDETPFAPSLEWEQADEPDPISPEPAEILVSEIEAEEPELLFDNLEPSPLPIAEAEDQLETTLPLAWEGMIEWDENVAEPIEEHTLLKVPEQEVLDEAVGEEPQVEPAESFADPNDFDIEWEEPEESDPPVTDLDPPVAEEVIGMPALSVELSDRVDPVPVGGETEYEITLSNQGTADATGIQLSLVVPTQLTVTTVTGSAGYRQEEDRLIFEPVLKLSPNETTTFHVQATARQPGDVRMKLLIRTEAFLEGFQEQESTRIYLEEKTKATGDAKPLVPVP